MKQNLTIRSEPLNGLTMFRLVAQFGSFRRAADRLGISPSAVSQSVRALEARLGVTLLNRTSRSVALSEAGRQLFDEVDSSLTRIEAALEKTRAGQATPSGLLRINVSRLATTLFIEPRLEAFLARYPKIQLELFTDDTLTDVVSGGFDAGIRLGRHLALDMVALPLDRGQRRVVIGTPGYLARHGIPHTPADLAIHDCIRFRSAGSGRLQPWHFVDAGKDLQVVVSGRLIFADHRLCREAARAGLGLGQQFEQAVLPDIAAGRLVQVLGTYAPTLSGFYIYYPAHRPVPAKLRVFVDFLRETIDEGSDAPLRQEPRSTVSSTLDVPGAPVLPENNPG